MRDTRLGPLCAAGGRAVTCQPVGGALKPVVQGLSTPRPQGPGQAQTIWGEILDEEGFPRRAQAVRRQQEGTRSPRRRFCSRGGGQRPRGRAADPRDGWTLCHRAGHARPGFPGHRRSSSGTGRLGWPPGTRPAWPRAPLLLCTGRKGTFRGEVNGRRTSCERVEAVKAPGPHMPGRRGGRGRRAVSPPPPRQPLARLLRHAGSRFVKNFSETLSLLIGNSRQEAKRL